MNEHTIEQYSALADFLGQALGPHFEAILYDLHNIVATYNSAISGRNVGDPLTNTLKQIVRDRKYAKEDYLTNFRGLTANGKVLRCSCFFIKDKNGELEGFFCLNFDDNRFKELAEDLFRLCHPDSYVDRNIAIEIRGNEDSGTFYDTISGATNEVLQRVVGDDNIPSNRLTKSEKMEIIRQLYQRGVFQMKDSINTVGQQLDCSQATMYRYIAQIKKEDRQFDPISSLET
ncbi:Predicted transcriptional regulator YheO, contains PAS and DNA-binding HTH domains [Lachnospiraceae bacterium]|nr:Predicted transcriptional regulator YheO, contains PAS and DNA-binding HTH domains [Lachnospiraceae bacterium]